MVGEASIFTEGVRLAIFIGTATILLRIARYHELICRCELGQKVAVV
eukprot:SAG11_NODE_427_length_9558_cov_4.909398_9_plen_47_part_00